MDAAVPVDANSRAHRDLQNRADRGFTQRPQPSSTRENKNLEQLETRPVPRPLFKFARSQVNANTYRAFATPYQQTCNNHLINRCTRLLEQASAATAVFPREVKALLQQGLALRDRFAAEEISAHGLTVATGRLEAELARLLDPCYRADENRRLANHLDREFPFLFAYLGLSGFPNKTRGSSGVCRG